MLSHAMFKALLFLAIGWLSVLVGGTAAAKMSGGVRRHPELGWLIGVGLLALAGVPPLVGFVSKEYVLGAAHESISESGSVAGWIVLVAMGVTVALTAAYCARAWLVLTHVGADGEPLAMTTTESPDEVADVSLFEMFPETTPAGEVTPDSAHSLVPTMVAVHAASDHGHASIHNSARLSVGILALLSVVGGLIIFTPLVRVEPHITWWLVAVSLLLILTATGVVRRLSLAQASGDAADGLGADRMALFDRGFGADGVYVAIASQVVQLARVVVAADRQVIDAYVRGTVVATRWAGISGERAHTSKPSSYLVWVLCGLLAVGMAGVTLW
jgi:NADH-quinone oxidoreductase subunit L